MNDIPEILIQANSARGGFDVTTAHLPEGQTEHLSDVLPPRQTVG